MLLIEQGEFADNGDNINWIYSATISVEHIAGYKIVVSAYDISGNVTVKDVLL
jgi:hypothetical protein